MVGGAKFSGHIRWSVPAPDGVGVDSLPGARAAVAMLMWRVGVGSVGEVGRVLDQGREVPLCAPASTVVGRRPKRHSTALKMTLIPQMPGPYLGHAA